jgi:hypothetical protein
VVWLSGSQGIIQSMRNIYDARSRGRDRMNH